MKIDLSHLEPFRVTKGEGATEPGSGFSGNFTFKVGETLVQCSASDEIDGWEHVICVAIEYPKSRILSRFTGRPTNPAYPNWEETMAVKRLFWEDDETVVEYWPAKGSLLPMSTKARHLWRRVHSDVPTPEPALKKQEN